MYQKFGEEAIPVRYSRVKGLPISGIRKHLNGASFNAFTMLKLA
jgi:hypothetical protein